MPADRPLTDLALATAVRAADPADPGATARSARALADLDRILAGEPAARPDRLRPGTPSTPSTPSTPGTPGTPRTRRTRLALAGAGVVATCTVAVLAPSVTGGDEAFATWVAVPDDDLGPSERAAVLDGCLDAQADGRDAPTASAAVVEARGVWTAAYLTGPGGWSALCITDSSTRIFHDMIGSAGRASGAVAPTGDQVRVTDLGTGTMSAGDVSLAAGSVGPDVAGISYESTRHGTVQATVSGGAFVLWLPGDEFGDGAPVEVTLTRTDASSTSVALDL